EKVVEVPVLKNGQLDRTEKILARVEEQGGKLLAEAAELRRLIAPAAPPRPTPTPVRTVTRSPVVSPPRPQRVEAPASGDVQLGRGGLRRMLIALAQRPGLTNRQLGLRAGLSSQSGTFS